MFLPTGLGEMHTGTVCNELPASGGGEDRSTARENFCNAACLAPAELHRIALLLTRAACVLLVRVC